MVGIHTLLNPKYGCFITSTSIPYEPIPGKLERRLPGTGPINGTKFWDSEVSAGETKYIAGGRICTFLTFRWILLQLQRYNFFISIVLKSILALYYTINEEGGLYPRCFFNN